MQTKSYIEYRNERVCNPNSANPFTARDAYLNGHEVWHEREYGTPTDRIKNDPRPFARFAWMMAHPLSVSCWTNSNIPEHEGRMLAEKWGGAYVEHFYGPAGYGFLEFTDTEKALAFVMSKDYSEPSEYATK